MGNPHYVDHCSAVIGMSIYGISNNPIDPNQLHILFMPMMSAFAIAMVSILWARVPISQTKGLPSLIPFVAIIIITTIPMVINLQNEIRYTGPKVAAGQNPYIHNQILTKYLNETDIVFSDQPWAVAWYADRTAIWIPKGSKPLQKIESIAKQSVAKISGIYLTPSIRTEGFQYQLYGDLTPLTLNLLNTANGQGFAEYSPITSKIISPTNGRYPFRAPMSEDRNNRISPFSYILYTDINPAERLDENEAKTN